MFWALLRSSQLSILDSSLSMDSSSSVDFGLMAGSLVDSQFDFEVEIDSEPGSATDSGFVADFDSVTGFDSATEECSLPAILQLIVDNSQ